MNRIMQEITKKTGTIAVLSKGGVTLKSPVILVASQLPFLKDLSNLRL